MSAVRLRARGEQSQNVDRPWLVLVACVLGSYLIAINTGIFGVALPAIADDLGMDGSEADWIITTYLLGLAVAQPVSSWLGDRFGRRDVYVCSMVLFAIGSIACIAASGTGVMLVGRLVMGLGGGAIFPLAMAMIYEAFPEERRGTMIGVWGVAVAAGPAVGPPVGGWAITNASWRWIFIAMLALSIVGAVASLLWLRPHRVEETGRLDWRSWAAISIALTALIGVARGLPSWGLAPTTVLLGLVTVVAAVWFVRRALSARQPLLDLRMFAIPGFRVTMAILAMITVGQYARLNYLPVMLQTAHGMTAFEVGLMLVAPALAVSSTMPLGGMLHDRFGVRLPVLCGLSLNVLTMGMIALIDLNTPRLTIVGLLIGQGMASGLVWSPLTVHAMNAVGESLTTQASTMSQVVRQTAAAVGTAALATVLVASIGAVTPVVSDLSDAHAAQGGFNRLFAVTTAVLAAALLLGLRVGSARSHPRRDPILDPTVGP